MKALNIRINLRSIRKKYVENWTLKNEYDAFGYYKHQIIRFEKSGLKNPQ